MAQYFKLCCLPPPRLIKGVFPASVEIHWQSPRKLDRPHCASVRMMSTVITRSSRAISPIAPSPPLRSNRGSDRPAPAPRSAGHFQPHYTELARGSTFRTIGLRLAIKGLLRCHDHYSARIWPGHFLFAPLRPIRRCRAKLPEGENNANGRRADGRTYLAA